MNCDKVFGTILYAPPVCPVNTAPLDSCLADRAIFPIKRYKYAVTEL
jgi:hypothetical protein